MIPNLLLFFSPLFTIKPNSPVSAAAKNHPSTLHLSGNPEWQPRFIDLLPRTDVGASQLDPAPQGPGDCPASVPHSRQPGPPAPLQRLQPHSLHPNPFIRTCKSKWEAATRGVHLPSLSAQGYEYRAANTRVPKTTASVPIPRGCRE